MRPALSRGATRGAVRRGEPGPLMILNDPPAVFGDGIGEPTHDDALTIPAVHAEIDRRTEAFRAATGLACPQGCGACCLSPNVETSASDILPLAEELVRRGEAEAMLARLELAGMQCVLYEAASETGDRGRCTMYDWRPSICRLFGFAGQRDADGQPRFTPCRVHGQVLPEVAAAAKEAAESGRVALPIFTDLAGQVAALAPGGRGRLQPINAALREALHSAALTWRYAAQVATPSEDDDDARPRTPGSPRAPRRRVA